MTCTVAEVHYALLTLSDLTESPLVAEDDDETVADWWADLQHFDSDDLHAAVERWTAQNARWPTRREFVSVTAEVNAERRRREAIERGVAHPIAGTVCPECGLYPADRHTHLVEEPDPSRPEVLIARPCSLCETGLYARYLDGHWPAHQPGECTDPDCQAVGRRRRR